METFHVYMPVSQLIFNSDRHFLYIYKAPKSTRCPCDDPSRPGCLVRSGRDPRGVRAPVPADPSGSACPPAHPVPRVHRLRGDDANRAGPFLPASPERVINRRNEDRCHGLKLGSPLP